MRKISLCLLFWCLLLLCSLAVAEEALPARDDETPHEVNVASARTLEQLGAGVLRYLRARGKFPLLKNPLDWQAQRTFYPYVGDERLFVQPETDLAYRFNEILSGKKPAHIINPQSFAVFYEAGTADDGRRGVLFLDGHVERVKPAHWEKIKKASKIADGVAR